jgi:hypothetical protein
MYGTAASLFLTERKGLKNENERITSCLGLLMIFNYLLSCSSSDAKDFSSGKCRVIFAFSSRLSPSLEIIKPGFSTILKGHILFNVVTL